MLAIKGSCKDLINGVKGERYSPSIFQIAHELTEFEFHSTLRCERLL